MTGSRIRSIAWQFSVTLSKLPFILYIHVQYSPRHYYFASDKWANYCDRRVCKSVCLSVSLPVRSQISKTTCPEFYQIFCISYLWLWLSLLWRQCNTLRTSDFCRWRQVFTQWSEWARIKDDLSSYPANKQTHKPMNGGEYIPPTHRQTDRCSFLERIYIASLWHSRSVSLMPMTLLHSATLVACVLIAKST